MMADKDPNGETTPERRAERRRMQKVVDSMVPLLTGWLAMGVFAKAGDTMKVVGVDLAPPDAFTVRFASGLALRVTVAEEAAISTK